MREEEREEGKEHKDRQRNKSVVRVGQSPFFPFL